MHNPNKAFKESWKRALIFMIGESRFEQCNFETEFNKFRPEWVGFTSRPEEETAAFRDMIFNGNLNICSIE